MRILGKISYIFFIIITIINTSFSLIFGLSSTRLTKLDDSRFDLYYKAANKFTTSKYLTISITKPKYEGDILHTSRDKIICVVNDTTNEYDCSMTSTLHTTEGNLVRTSYFPGDGYKYTITNNENIEERIKTNDTEFENYFINNYIAIRSFISYLILTPANIDSMNVSYNSNTKFDFNTFSLIKQVTINYKANETPTYVKLVFNKNDYLTKLEAPDLDSTAKFEISYKKNSMTFPSFVGFMEIQGGE